MASTLPVDNPLRNNTLWSGTCRRLAEIALSDSESLSVTPKPKATRYELGRIGLTEKTLFVLNEAASRQLAGAFLKISAVLF
jgi:hypothetical protein